MKRLITFLLIACFVVACGRTSSAPAATTNSDPRITNGERRTTDRKYLLERGADAAVVQYCADGFEELPLREKTLIWHLYQAAIAGRDIFIDQRHRNALEMRSLLDQLAAHRSE